MPQNPQPHQNEGVTPFFPDGLQNNPKDNDLEMNAEKATFISRHCIAWVIFKNFLGGSHLQHSEQQGMTSSVQNTRTHDCDLQFLSFQL